jgi:hypothetical protein
MADSDNVKPSLGVNVIIELWLSNGSCSLPLSQRNPIRLRCILMTRSKGLMRYVQVIGFSAVFEMKQITANRTRKCTLIWRTRMRSRSKWFQLAGPTLAARGLLLIWQCYAAQCECSGSQGRTCRLHWTVNRSIAMLMRGTCRPFDSGGFQN